MSENDPDTIAAMPGDRDARSHWAEVWNRSDGTEKSWYQETPRLSMSLLAPHVTPGCTVVDVGAGASTLADALIDAGASVTLVDISGEALQVTLERLAKGGHSATTVVTDIRQWQPTEQFDIWHDRAALHFLTADADIDAYVRVATSAVRPGGILVISGFGPDGPMQCSGLDTIRRSTDELAELFGEGFTLIESEMESHQTPTGSQQEFVAVALRRLHD